MNKPDTIRLWRLTAKMNQTEFGELIGVSRIAVSNWERGVFKIPNWAISSLQQILEIPRSKQITRDTLLAGQ